MHTSSWHCHFRDKKQDLPIINECLHSLSMMKHFYIKHSVQTSLAKIDDAFCKCLQFIQMEWQLGHQTKWLLLLVQQATVSAMIRGFNKITKSRQ